MDWMYEFVLNVFGWLLSTFLLLCLLCSLTAFIVLLCKKKKKTAAIALVFMMILAISSAGIILGLKSHSTYYKYNDWYIIGNSKEKIEKRYGEFLYDTVYEDGSGVAEYKADRPYKYYCMKYDKNGIVYEVYRERGD